MTETAGAPLQGLLHRLRLYLPRAGQVPEPSWRRRHLLVRTVLILHVPILVGYAQATGAGLGTAIGYGVLVGGCAGMASMPGSRTARAAWATGGLLACSAILVQVSGGLIEFHLHFFASLALVSLYQEWVPFALALGYVVLHHGILGALDPASVYHHPWAANHPWRWALIHAGFAAAACGTYVAQWRLTEDLRADAQVLLESAGAGVLGVDLDGRVTFANPAAATILARPLTQVVDRPADELMPGLSLPLKTNASRLATESTVPGPEGRPVPVEWLVTPSLRRGVPRGFVVTFRDITDRRQAERERAKAREEQIARLREIDEMRSRFLRTAAHELRTPLTPLRLQVDLLKLQGPSADPRGLDTLSRNLDRLQMLVDDMLSVTRLEAGKLEIRLGSVELATALREVQETFAPLALQQGVELVCSCPPGLVLRADPLRLEQVLVNLVSNALRHTARGGRVTITAMPNPGHAVLRVTDTGRGLTKEQLALLFEPFAQVHAAAADRGGTGLGLHITKSLVELHGGRIWAESDGPGRGASFACSWPLEMRQPKVELMSQKTGLAVPSLSS